MRLAIETQNKIKSTNHGLLRAYVYPQKICIYIKKFSSNVFFHDYVKLYRKIYHKTIKAAKSIYYNERLAKSGNIAKETWSVMNDLTNKPSSQSTVSTSSESLNDYFVNVAENLMSSINPSNDPLSYLPNANENFSQFILHACSWNGA